MTRFALALLAALAPLAAHAHEYRAGAVTIGHPYIHAAPAAARSAAGYMTLQNQGDAPAVLVAVEAELPRSMIHDSVESDGVVSMQHVEDLTVAPGETVTFAPGGLHVMFMGIEEPLAIGDRLPATLVFADGARAEVEFVVEERPEAEDAAHDAHSGH